MAVLYKSYTSELSRELQYLATWPPNAPVEVGDVALMIDRAPERQSSLADLGVTIKERPGPHAHHQGWVSRGAVGISPTAKVASGTPSATANAKVRLTFNRTHALFFRAERTQEVALDRLDQVRQAMLTLHAEEKWNPDWVLVTHVVRAQRLVVLVSGQEGSTADLGISGSVGSEVADLAERADIGVEISHTHGMAYELKGLQNATPLFHALRVRPRRLFGSARLQRISKRGRLRPGPGDYEVVDVTY